jgi:hypothetical protein
VPKTASASSQQFSAHGPHGSYHFREIKTSASEIRQTCLIDYDHVKDRNTQLDRPSSRYSHFNPRRR